MPVASSVVTRRCRGPKTSPPHPAPPPPMRGLMASCSREQKHQRQQPSDPGRGGNEMQDIGGQMQGSQFTGRCAGVAGPGDGCDQAKGRSQRQPFRRRKPVKCQASGKDDRQHEADFGHQPELRLVQYRPEHARRHGLAERQSAHRDGLRQQPEHPRRHGDRERGPRHAQGLRPQQLRRHRFQTPGGPRHDRAENQGSRGDRGGSKMDRANGDQGPVGCRAEPVHRRSRPIDRPER